MHLWQKPVLPATIHIIIKFLAETYYGHVIAVLILQVSCPSDKKLPSLVKKWAGIRKKGLYGGLWFFECVYHAQSPIWARHAFFARSFLKVSPTHLRTAKALVRLRLWAGSLEPLLVSYVISTLFSCAGSNPLMLCMLGKKFSKWQTDNLSYFFQENRVWHFMQIVSIRALEILKSESVHLMKMTSSMSPFPKKKICVYHLSRKLMTIGSPITPFK